MDYGAFDRIEINEENPEEVFEILEEVGIGNFGVVVKARNRITEDIVAIKQVLLTDTDEMNALANEVDIMQKCDHPNIVRYYGTYRTKGRLWIVMEYCEGGSADAIYDVLRRPLSEKLIAYVCRQTLLGLKYLHERHILHRDIKGANILLTADGEVKLADFGVSTELRHTMSRRNTFIGTVLWMAPEAITEMDYNDRADIWSLGITAIELAEGRPPRHGMHVARAVFSIPREEPPTLSSRERWTPQINAFIRRLVTKDKQVRPSAADMLGDPFVSPAFVADQSEMAAVVHDVFKKRMTLFDEDESSDSSNASKGTIVTCPSDNEEDEEPRAGNKEGKTYDGVSTEALAGKAGGGGPPGGARDAARGAHGDAKHAFASQLTRMPLLSLEHFSFDALSPGRSLELLHAPPAASPAGVGEQQEMGADGFLRPKMDMNKYLRIDNDPAALDARLEHETQVYRTVRDAYLFYHMGCPEERAAEKTKDSDRVARTQCGSALAHLYRANTEYKKIQTLVDDSDEAYLKKLKNESASTQGQSSEGETLRETLSRLYDERSGLEQRLKESLDFLASTPAGLDGRLIDGEGFPRDDCDLYAVRAARNTVSCTRNDLKTLQEKMYDLLNQLHGDTQDEAQLQMVADAASHRQRQAAAVERARQIARLAEIAKQAPCLIVAKVDASSPAEEAGLEEGMRILKFGGVSKAMIDKEGLQVLAKETTDHEGAPISVWVRRGPVAEDGVTEKDPEEIILVPQRWSGKGLLGCAFDVIRS